MAALLEFTNVAFEGLLSNLSFSIASGEVCVVLGPNGAGKSTLAKLAMRILTPTAGHVSGSASDARALAWVPQQVSESLDFSVLEVVLFGRTPHASSSWSGHSQSEQKLANEALVEVELQGHAQRAFSTLSGGEKRRVFLARALAQNASLLVLDEPTTHLDLKHQRKLIHTIETLRNRGVGVLAVLHDVNLAHEVATKVLLLKSGTAFAFGSAKELLNEQQLSALFETPMHQGTAWTFRINEH